MSGSTLPGKLRQPMRRAVRLEIWNIVWTTSTIIVLGLVLGQSQTMKTTWVEDTLGLVPPTAFLIAAFFEMRRRPSARFPFGYERANGLGFFVAAMALTLTGTLLLWDSASTLLASEHATVGSVVILGHEIWLGWLMIGAQFYALVPPLIIGRMELPLARELNDNLIHTDALMNKASWHTGAAGIAGIIGIGLGWWWADALAAAVIAFGIISDGITSLRSAVAELIDGAPRELSDNALAAEGRKLKAALTERFPGATVRLRETGRVLRAEVCGAKIPATLPRPEDVWPGDPDRSWRLAEVTFGRGETE